jgi:uncharacterized phage-associated protein
MSTSIAPASAAGVANEFLELGQNENGLPPIDQMKLQKLLFYAHAWYLALNDMPLFDEDFEAWSWGPVIRDVYYQTKDFGRAPVSKELLRLTPAMGGSLLDATFEKPRIEDPELKKFIRAVWDSHKRLTGVQLSNSTHGPGEPWTIMKDRYPSLAHSPTIPNDLIAEVFKKKLANESAKDTAA